MSGERRAESVKNLNILVDILLNIRLRGRIILIFLKIVQKPTYYLGQIVNNGQFLVHKTCLILLGLTDLGANYYTIMQIRTLQEH